MAPETLLVSRSLCGFFISFCRFAPPPFSTHVRLVSPHAGSPLASPATEMRLDEFENVTFRTIDAQLGNPYQSPSQYEAPIKPRRDSEIKGSESDASSAPPPPPSASVS